MPSNTRKPDGKRRTARRPEIVVKAGNDGEHIMLSVADHGPGIPKPTAAAWSNASCVWSKAGRSPAPGWA